MLAKKLSIYKQLLLPPKDLGLCKRRNEAVRDLGWAIHSVHAEHWIFPNKFISDEHCAAHAIGTILLSLMDAAPAIAQSTIQHILKDNRELVELQLLKP